MQTPCQDTTSPDQFSRGVRSLAVGQNRLGRERVGESEREGEAVWVAYAITIIIYSLVCLLAVTTNNDGPKRSAKGRTPHPLIPFKGVERG